MKRMIPRVGRGPMCKHEAILLLQSSSTFTSEAPRASMISRVTATSSSRSPARSNACAGTRRSGCIPIAWHSAQQTCSRTNRLLRFTDLTLACCPQRARRGTLGPQTSVAFESAANKSGDASGFTAAMLSRSSAYTPIGSVQQPNLRCKLCQNSRDPYGSECEVHFVPCAAAPMSSGS